MKMDPTRKAALIAEAIEARRIRAYWSDKAIARRFNVHHSTVKKLAYKHGQPRA